MIINAKFRKEPIDDPVDDQEKYGLDSILMFQCNSIPYNLDPLVPARSKSLDRIRQNMNDYIFWSYSFSKYKGKTLGIFSQALEVVPIWSIFKGIEKHNAKTCTLATLPEWLNDKYGVFDFWWDTQLDFMCWKEEDGIYKIEDWHTPKLVFETKYKKVIKFKG